MMITALLFTPWAKAIKDTNAEPRALADDLMATISGNKYLSFVDSVKATLQHVIDMGGRAASTKSNSPVS